MVHPCLCISVWDGASCIFGSSIFYLTFFLGCGVGLGFLAGCSWVNVWYGAPVPESYLAAAARAFMAIVFEVEMTGFLFGASTCNAPRAYPEPEPMA